MPAIVPLIIAGGTIGGAAISAHAAGKAAETQAGAAERSSADQLTAAREALDFQKQQYNNTQRAVNPYQNMGSGALAMLGNGLGVTPGTMAPNTVPTGPTAAPQSAGLLTPQPLRPLQQVTHANLSPGQQLTVAQRQTQSGVNGTVRLQSPDGSETQDVPQAQAQYYLSKGAKVVQ